MCLQSVDVEDGRARSVGAATERGAPRSRRRRAPAARPPARVCRDTTLYRVSLRYITLYYTTLHYTVLHYIRLHRITLHYTTLVWRRSEERRGRAAAEHLHEYVMILHHITLFYYYPIRPDHEILG